jgi:chemotaxis protein MotA
VCAQVTDHPSIAKNAEGKGMGKGEGENGTPILDFALFAAQALGQTRSQRAFGIGTDLVHRNGSAGRISGTVSIIVGLAIVFGSIVVGYTMHGGNIAVLLQISEFIIIGGAGLGAIIVGNKPSVVKQIVAQSVGLIKANPYNRAAYAELLQVLYDVFYAARRDGLVGIEKHIEDPESSDIFQKYPAFRNNEHALYFLADTMKVLLTGTVEDHHLSEILDLDLDQYYEEAMVVPTAIHKVGDAMPGFGIVAAVLGVIITMGRIGGAASEVGASVAAALVGTFIGILLAYGVFGPIGQAIESRVRAEQAYMRCIRTALLSFARGDPPITSVEFARRNIEPADRPSFAELEDLTRRKAA